MAGRLQSLILCDALAGGTTIWVRVVAVELFELLAFRADVLVVFNVPVKVGTDPCAVGASGLVDHRDLAIDKPAKHRTGAISGIRDDALGVQIKIRTL